MLCYKCDIIIVNFDIMDNRQVTSKLPVVLSKSAVCQADKGRLDFAEAEKEQAENKLSAALSEIEDLKIRLSDKNRKISELTELSEQLDSECRSSRQTISELEKHITELTEENSSLKAQLESVPKLFRKNQ